MSSAPNAPWTVVVHYNDKGDLQELIAPAWVSTPSIRSTMDILQTCLLTLFACIYTALHLDVPARTTWYHILLSKVGWVLITLFAPEVSLYMAADQLQQAWKLRSNLRAIRHKRGAEHEDPGFNIDLRYAFFIVMGGVRVGVDNMLSLPDLDKGAFGYNSELLPDTLRLGPKAVTQLAERGHWIHISEKKIDDKSKADTLQKILVVIQVLWMIMQCITRQVCRLPLSLLEIHTMVHVVCALLLYICWFKKPLNVHDPEVVSPRDFKGEIAAMLQQQFYGKLSNKLVLFPQKDSPYQPPPHDEESGHSMRWIERSAGLNLGPGKVLPSGLGYSSACPDRWENCRPFKLTDQFFNRWDAILGTFPFENRAELAKSAMYIDILSRERRHYLRSDKPQALFLARLDEFSQESKKFYRNTPFSEGKRNIDINIRGDDPLDGHWIWMPLSFWLAYPWLLPLAIALSAAYGGIHVTAWNSVFPSQKEELFWKISCLYVASMLPLGIAFVAMAALLDFIYKAVGVEDDKFWGEFVAIVLWLVTWLTTWAIVIAYLVSRVYIIVEAFISLRHVPIGVYVSPSWVQMIPHF